MDNTRFARFEGYIGSAAKSIARLKAARMARFQLSAAHTSSAVGQSSSSIVSSVKLCAAGSPSTAPAR